MQLLVKHPFPGNVRELKNLIERLVILTTDDVIDEGDVRAVLPIYAGGAASATDGHYRPGASLREMLEAAERDLIIRSLEHHKGNATHAARDLGLERSHFYKKMRSLGIRRPGAEGDAAEDDDENS